MHVVSFEAARERITDAADHYGDSAPALRNWLNDLCIRLEDAPETVYALELAMLEQIQDCEEWQPAHTVENHIYKLADRLGRNTAMMLGY